MTTVAGCITAAAPGLPPTWVFAIKTAAVDLLSTICKGLLGDLIVAPLLLNKTAAVAVDGGWWEDVKGKAPGLGDKAAGDITPLTAPPPGDLFKLALV